MLTLRIYTIGTGHRSLADFVHLLVEHGVEVLADVRSYPKSHLTHFDRPYLEVELPRLGLDHHWLGNDLGGLRRDGYRAHMQTPRFANGIRRLEELAQHHVTAICCAEIDPERCHRRFIADALSERGWEVVHIVGDEAASLHVVQPMQGELPFG